MTPKPKLKDIKDSVNTERPSLLPGRYVYTHLNDAVVQEFAAIWETSLGEPIIIEEARMEATKLIQLYMLISPPLPEAEMRRAA